MLINSNPIVEHITIDNEGSILHNKIIGGYVKNRGGYGRRRAEVVQSENDSKIKLMHFL